MHLTPIGHPLLKICMGKKLWKHKENILWKLKILNLEGFLHFSEKECQSFFFLTGEKLSFKYGTVPSWLDWKTYKSG